MWCSRTIGSWRDILNLCRRHCLLAEGGTQECRGIEVNFPSQQFREFPFHPKEFEPRHVSRFELDEDINVARRREVLAQHRTEQRQSMDVPMPANPANRSRGIETLARFIAPPFVI